ncbi:MAG: hypothetical protein RBG13Loki_0402 [Promethearchaeota archaeon CR_4]|nr:MAG: hypothetical protein RBG13Loki_0402 [Candidatus Lokiarchaeota archaeon CR_4]
MGYFSKILSETVDAINRCYEKNVTHVNVGRIRKCTNVKSTDRSKIVFISRALDELSQAGFLEYLGKNSPKTYQVKEKINWTDVLREVQDAQD